MALTRRPPVLSRMLGTRYLRPSTWSGSAAHPEIMVLQPWEWAELRAVRLRALRESSDAFIADYATERRLPPQMWRERLTSSTWIIVRSGRSKIGTASLVRDPAHPQDRYVECVWVAPGYRKRGILRSMMADLALRAHDQGSDDLLLWVLESNYEASDAYLKLGFEYTGERQPIALDEDRIRNAARTKPRKSKIPDPGSDDRAGQVRHELQMRRKFIDNGGTEG